MVSPTATVLARLSAVLLRHDPALRTFLADGLSQEVITSRLAQVPRPPAREVVAFYAWHNGLVAHSPVAVELFPNAVMLSLDEAITEYQTFMAYPAEDRLWQPAWFPLFTNRGIGGDYYVSRLPEHPRQHAPVLYTSWRDHNAMTNEGLGWRQAYDSLTSLLRTVTAAWVDGAYRVADQLYVEVADTRRLGHLFRRHNPDTVALDVAHATNGGSVADLLDAYFRDERGRTNSADRAIWAVQDEAMAREVLRRLASDEPETRQIAAYLLGHMGVTEAVPALVERLADPQPSVAGTALTALSKLGDPRAVAPVLALLPQADTQWRRGLLWCLGHLADSHAVGPDTVPVLLTIVETDSDPEVRIQAIRVLHAIGDLQVIPTLVTLSQTSERADVRGQALWTAGLLGGTALEKTVAAVASGDLDKEVRATATKLLDHFQALRAEG